VQLLNPFPLFSFPSLFPLFFLPLSASRQSFYVVNHDNVTCLITQMTNDRDIDRFALSAQIAHKNAPPPLFPLRRTLGPLAGPPLSEKRIKTRLGTQIGDYKLSRSFRRRRFSLFFLSPSVFFDLGQAEWRIKEELRC